LQNIRSFIGLFCKRDLEFCRGIVMCVTWLIHIMSHITHDEQSGVDMCVPWYESCVSHDSYISCHTCDSMTRWCVCASFICVPWLIHMCAMIHSCVCHDSFICLCRGMSHVCHMTHTYHETHHSRSECACVSHDSYILCHTSLMKWVCMCVTWLIHIMSHITQEVSVTHHPCHATVSRIDKIIGLFCRIFALL